MLHRSWTRLAAGGIPAMLAGVLAASDPMPQLQPFQAIQTPDALQVHRPALTSQQHVHPPIAVAWSGVREFAHAVPECVLARSTTAVAVERPGDL